MPLRGDFVVNNMLIKLVSCRQDALKLKQHAKFVPRGHNIQLLFETNAKKLRVQRAAVMYIGSDLL